MKVKKERLTPRKKPVQSRSIYTVEAIYEATIQVLLATGPEKLTTTKVAARAGVSVGTLYQYFGDKQGLLSAVLEKHLTEVVEAVEEACLAGLGNGLEVVTESLVETFFRAKYSNPEASKALYAISSLVEGDQKVMKLMQRAQVSICALLSSVSDAKIDDPITASFVVSTSIIGPVQSLLEMDAPQEYQEKVCGELKRMLYGYLKEVAK